MTGQMRLRSDFLMRSYSIFRTSGKLLPLVLIFCLHTLCIIGGSVILASGQVSAAETAVDDQVSPESNPSSLTQTDTLEDSIVISLDPPQSVAPATVRDDESPLAEIQSEPAATQPNSVAATTPVFPSAKSHCAKPYSNNYRKSLAFTSFPRSSPASGNAGALYQVEQRLPLLLSANLTAHHSTLSLLQLPEGFYSADFQGETRAAAQAQALARKHRVQFIVSGQVRDMSLTHPDKAYTRGLHNRLANGVTNLLNSDPPGNTNSRIFSFQLQLRDGLTGQLVFDQFYETYGKWDVRKSAEMGFGSARFWQTDYGKKIENLVSRASHEMAAQVHCQPYMARVDLRPGRQQVVIHSGANNGLRRGDALALHQLVLHPITGGYDNVDAQLVNRNTPVYLTEVYPSHSLATIGQDVLLNGQYLVLAP